MPIDLSGIQNVGEFYSHHYLDALLEQDLKGLFARWRGTDSDHTPDRRLNRCATDFFRAKTNALRQRQPELRYPPSHAIHVELLEALGYPYDFGVRYLADGSAVPILGAIKRDGRPYLWLVETTFTDPDDAPLDQLPFRAQYPPGADADGYDVPTEPWEILVGEIFRCDEPPRWLILFAGCFVYLSDRTKWGQGQYLLFDLNEILGRCQRDTLRATAALLSRDALCPDEGVPLHDTLGENSHKHAYGVSEDPEYGVRRAVELLVNEAERLSVDAIDLRSELLQLVRPLANEWASPKILIYIAPQWSEICRARNRSEFDELSETLRAFAKTRRRNLLGAIEALLPIIARLGGERAVRETAQAIIDTARWWP